MPRIGWDKYGERYTGLDRIIDERRATEEDEMAKKRRGEWRRHDGGPCPVDERQRGQRIQWRVIGSDRARIQRGYQMDWGLTFEWRWA